MAERPPDADDLPLATYQTDEERRLADLLLASRYLACVGAVNQLELPGGGHPGYRPSGNGQHEHAPELIPRRLSLRALTERIRVHS